jgi:hypothetical protein
MIARRIEEIKTAAPKVNVPEAASRSRAHPVNAPEPEPGFGQG